MGDGMTVIRAGRRRPSTKSIVESRKHWRIGYQRYLDSPEWKQFRSEWLDRHPRTGCFVCGIRPPDIQLHHVRYDKLGSESDDHLRAMCRAHHEAIHAYAKRHRLKVYEATYAYRSYWKSQMR